MQLVFTLHSLVRWILLIVAIIALLRFAIGWLQNLAFQPMDRGLMSGFTGLVDVQLLLGLILLFGYAGMPRYQWEHAVSMILAVIVAHLPMRWRDEESSVRFRNNLAVILVVLLLVIAGIAVLPGNRWTL